MESKILGFGLREYNSRNPEPTDGWNPESSSWNPESTGVEFRIQDCLGIPVASPA